jgi:sorbitol/mannitol transport system substrate-binding protein
MRWTGFAFSATVALVLAGSALAQTTLTIATVNNPDMIVMQRLSAEFEAQHPDINLEWVVLPENELRQRVTTDIATGAGNYDILTIGTYEVPIWGALGWLTPFDDVPAGYDLDDVYETVRLGLSHDGTLYALPFYAESSITFYRTDLFEQAGLEMPDQPTYDQIIEFAAALHDPGNNIYGSCQRGKPGWGENMAYVATLVNTFGGRWFDMDWQPQIDSPAWHEAISFYVDMMQKYGPPGAASNGHLENRTLFASGNCAMWVDATSAAGYLFDPSQSRVADSVGFAQAPVARTDKGAHWLWSWALAIPTSTQNPDAAKQFLYWATSRDYIELVAEDSGWVAVPPGTRISTYENPAYLDAAPFAGATLEAMLTADPTDSTLEPVPYTGVQFVGIPEFQAVGTQVGQFVAGALAGQMTVEDALSQAQAATDRIMREAGYY